MKKNRFIFINFALVFLSVLVVWVLEVFGTIENDYLYTFIYSAGITSSNFLLGLFLINKGFKKNDKLFLVLVLGGMTARMFLVLILIIVALGMLKFNIYSFIFTTFILYIFFLIGEIRFILAQEK
ncbi:MAG TPA: hypothetical protein PK397_10620 [Ignavibacteriaceae bacterium]|nr:hypothetical protein [Ignavibacteriaceae bacterium]